MTKHYTFDDCVDYAYKHNIAFNFYYYKDLHCLYADISDGADGYITATQAMFEYDNFSKRWRASMNLNIRYAYAKDYELMRRLESALNHRDGIRYVRAAWNKGITTWHGNGCFSRAAINPSYVRAESVHGNEMWHDDRL